MNGKFETIIMDKDAVLKMFDTITDSDGKPIAIAMDGKSITRYPEEVPVWMPL
jgi:hypothetical protein